MDAKPDLRKCQAFSRPLCAEENNAKSDKIYLDFKE
jgi:hypothetical protein